MNLVSILLWNDSVFACVRARHVISMAWLAIILDKGDDHMYHINTYLLCDWLLRFTIFIKFIIGPNIYHSASDCS